VILNAHGGNAPALNFAAQMINRDAHMFVCVDSGETSDVDVYKLAETPNDVHSGEIETSTSLAIRPHLVRMDKARKAVPRFKSRYLDFTSKKGSPLVLPHQALQRLGRDRRPHESHCREGREDLAGDDRPPRSSY